MDPINSNVSTTTQLYALKKAIDLQWQGVMQVLESASASSVTGIGQTLDIRA